MAAEALSGDVIKLDDGREVRLLGIKAAGNKAKDHLQSLLDQQTLVLENGVFDRYGRIAADVYAQPAAGDRIWLQGNMLAAGLAFVYPPTGTEPHVGDLLALENPARLAHVGLWNEARYSVLDAAEPRTIRYGHYAFVQGVVVKAERVKSMFYLNFGENWRTDFTIAIAAHDLRLFRNAGLDPAAYQGKTIRVRGWVKRNFGPMITVTHPSQIEVLGEAPTKP